MSLNNQKYQERIYKYSDSCVFRKTKELFGGLSNMASGFPIKINGTKILTSEALYQACRFPHLPEIQSKIILEKSPMSAKMVSKPYRDNSRTDWDDVRLEIMYWCLRVKLAQNFITFGSLLETTFNKPIVEDSSKDRFWGAVKDKDNDTLTGVNALGRYLMKLRQEYNSECRYDLLYVEPLKIPDFMLYNEPIQIVDERLNFTNSLLKRWNLHHIEEYVAEVNRSNSLPIIEDVPVIEESIVKPKEKAKRKTSVKSKTVKVKSDNRSSEEDKLSLFNVAE
jgi:ribA/ribD-fused uncharacterized protein